MRFIRFLALGLCFAKAHADLTLEDAEERAIANNRFLSSARERIELGRYGRNEAVGGYLPQLNLSGEARKTGSLAGAGDLDTYSSTVGVTQSLLDAQAYQNIRVKQHDLDLLRLDYSRDLNALLFDVRTAYYRVVLCQEAVEVELQNLALLEEALDREERKLSLGESTAFSVNQSKVVFANALSRYYDALKRHKIDQDLLADLLGMDPNDASSLVIDLKAIPVLAVDFLRTKIQEIDTQDDQDFISRYRHLQKHSYTPIFDENEVREWEEIATQNRPEVRRQARAVQLSVQKVSKARSEWIPRVDAFGDFTNRSSGGINIGGSNSFWNWGVRLSWRFFDGLARENRIWAAQSGRKIDSILYDQAVNTAKIAVRDRFFEIEESLLSYLAARQSVEVAKDAIDQAKKRRDLGVITALEYRDVTIALTQARQTFNNASFDLLIAYYGLLRDAGLDVMDES